MLEILPGNPLNLTISIANISCICIEKLSKFTCPTILKQLERLTVGFMIWGITLMLMVDEQIG